jgi:caffeoyl-CoA O-methyltransferase
VSPIIDPGVEAYVEAHTTAPTAALAAVAEETRATLSSPQMLTGAVEGRFLELLAFATGAHFVLEIGTFSGYSALSMAAGLPPDGRIVTCEVSEEHAAVARRHIAASPWAGQIDVRVGRALETIAELDGPFDLVFVDADKEGYPAYYEACVPKLSERGLLVIDNTLQRGRVVDPAPDDERARGMARFNDMVLADPRTTSVMLTVRDGVTLVRLAAPAT